MAAGVELEPSLAAFVSDLTYALSVIAFVPLAVLLTAMAVVGVRTRAFPAWLNGLTALVAAANLVMSMGLIVDSGPFVPGGSLTYVLYLLMVIWLLATTTVMFVRDVKQVQTTVSLQRR
jgi:hypothetical protein